VLIRDDRGRLLDIERVVRGVMIVAREKFALDIVRSGRSDVNQRRSPASRCRSRRPSDEVFAGTINSHGAGRRGAATAAPIPRSLASSTSSVREASGRRAAVHRSRRGTPTVVILALAVACVPVAFGHR
jgi:cation transport ATPase